MNSHSVGQHPGSKAVIFFPLKKKNTLLFRNAEALKTTEAERAQQPVFQFDNTSYYDNTKPKKGGH